MKNLNTVSAGRKTVSMEQKEKKLAGYSDSTCSNLSDTYHGTAVDLGCIYKFDG